MILNRQLDIFPPGVMRMPTEPLNLIPRSAPDIRIAIAGMGKMGHIHLTALRQLAAGESERYYKGGVSDLLHRLNMCGICDTRPLKAVEYPDIPLFDSVEQMLEKTCPHLLIVATPTPTHKTITATALRRKVHTLVEKPMVTTVADLQELLAVSEQSGARLMAGHVERYNPVSIKIESILRDIQPAADTYAFTRTQVHDPRIADDIVIDKVIHDLDLSLYFFGSIEDIRVVECRRRNGQVFEARLELLHKNGTQGQIFVSWLAQQPHKTRRIEIIQGGHSWTGDFLDKRLWVGGHEIQCTVPGWIEPDNNQIKDELVDFVAYCVEADGLNNIAPLLTMDEICESTRWLEYLAKKTANKSGGG
jgi:predicted dehydrogenase